MGLPRPNALGILWEGQTTPVPPKASPPLAVLGVYLPRLRKGAPPKNYSHCSAELLSHISFFFQKLMKLMRSDKRKGTQLTTWLRSGLRNEHSGLKHQHSNVGVSK